MSKYRAAQTKAPDTILPVYGSHCIDGLYLIFIMGMPKPSKTIFILKWDPDSLIHLSQVSLPM